MTKLIGYDLETKDPYLLEDGPGWARGVGHILGVAIARDKGPAEYVEVGEYPEPSVIKYLKDTLETDIPKVGANILYDMGWLSEIGVYPKGLQMDIQGAEALLDDVLISDYGARRSVSLEALSEHYLGIGKAKTEIDEFNRQHFPWSKDARENLWRMPTEIVAKYAIEDARLPIQIIKQQWSALQRESLTDLFILECKVLPILVKMRQRGLPISVDRAEETRDELITAEKITIQLLSELAGYKVNVNSSKDLAVIFDKEGIPYERTAKGNPSFTANFLASCDTPLANTVLDLRRLKKARTTFIENAILGKQINGKIYPSLHPLRNDESGTISGRFSSSKPNGQQIPKRNTKLAPLIRGMFVPEDGYPQWACLDLSQIEYRLFAHFANDERLIKAYQDPHTDFHAAVGKLIGGNLPRIAMKTINFGLLYGMGQTKLTAQLASLLPNEQNPLARAKALYRTYQTKFPAAKSLLSQYAKQAEQAPHEVTTILGRKARFKLWEPMRGDKPLPIGLAMKEYGPNLKVANTYKAINRVLQGSAADLLKKGMVDAEEAGIFEEIGYPHITVHDELDFSYHPDLRAGFRRLQDCVENALDLKVPVILGFETGTDWGHLS